MKKFAKTIDDYNKEDLEKEFCETTMRLIRYLEEEFYIPYFIDTLSSDDLKILKKTNFFKSFKLEMIDKFIQDNLDNICQEVFDILDIEYTGSNKDFLKLLDYEHIFKTLTNEIKDFFNMRSFDIEYVLKKRGIFKTSLVYPETVKELKDSIGDTFRMGERLDYLTRDYPFVDIDGTILVGKKNQTHAALIQEYLNELNTNQTIDDSFGRPRGNEVKKVLNNEYSSFGHIIDDNLFIDTFSLNNVSLDTVISDIKNSSISYKKIYKYNGEEITRLAKVIK